MCNTRHLAVQVAFLFYCIITNDVIATDYVIIIARLIWNDTLRHCYSPTQLIILVQCIVSAIKLYNIKWGDASAAVTVRILEW